MTAITYGVSKETYSYQGQTRTTYGLVAYADADTDGTATIVASARDLSDNRQSVEALASKCNQGNLSLHHFYDVIEDFLF